MRILENTIQEDNRNYDDCPMCDIPIKSFFHYSTVHHYIPYEDNKPRIAFHRFMIVKQRVLR